LDSMGHFQIPLPIDEISAKAQEVGRQGKPIHASFNLAPDKRAFGDTDFFFLPVPASGLVYVFVEFEYRLLQLMEMDVPQWSRWDVQAFSYKKNLPAESRSGFVTTNRYGYRAPDMAVPKPKGTFRVLCLGGSTTYEGRDNDNTYPALLQKELRTLFPGKRIEVMNCGVEGMNSRSNFLHVPAYLELEPDLIIGYLGVNDSQNDVQDICRSLVRFSWLSNWRFLDRRLTRPFWPSDDVIRSWFQAITITHLEGLRSIFARNGIRFALCSLAYVHYDDASYAKRTCVDAMCSFTGAFFAKLVGLLNPEIKQYCEQQGLLYIPVSENITDPEWLVDSCHLSQEGIALKAHIIAESLKDYIAPTLDGKD
jgi:lysophospholipase L1-like esterase